MKSKTYNAVGNSSAIYREPTPAEAELARLKAELTRLRGELAARERALDDLRSQLFSFEGRYIRQVGLLYKQLDEWEQRVAELHVGESVAAESAEPDEEVYAADDSSVEEPVDLRTLFRELAKRIHPDFATDALDEHRRTRLMAQANDALRRKDHGVLQRMLNGFDPPADFGGAQAIEAEIAEAQALIQDIQHDIEVAEAETKALRHSELANLQQRTQEAAAQGRDLLAEMAARVKGRIGMTMRQYDLDLDLKKRPAKGQRAESLVTAETHREPVFDPKLRRWRKDA